MLERIQGQQQQNTLQGIKGCDSIQFEIWISITIKPTEIRTVVRKINRLNQHYEALFFVFSIDFQNSPPTIIQYRQIFLLKYFVKKKKFQVQRKVLPKQFFSIS